MTVNHKEVSTEETCYTFIIQTGANIPTKDKTAKWNDGSMMLTINPGSEHESELIRVEEHFPTDTEGAVTVDFWLPANIGEPKLLKVDLESNRIEIIKDALYVRQITIVYDRESYRFPIKNYIYPHNPMAGNPTTAEMGCPPHFLVREGAGTLKHLETEKFIIDAREEDLNTLQSMVSWFQPGKNKKDKTGLHPHPGFFGELHYSKLPRFLKFREATMKAFEELKKPVKEEIRGNVLENIMEKVTHTYHEKHFNSFEKYEKYIKDTSKHMGWSKEIVLESLKVAKVFRTDEEFGRQMLCGPNGLQIRKVLALDERWTGGSIPAYAMEGKTVQKAIEEGRLFEIDNDDLVGVSHGGKRSKELTGTKETWYVVLADCLLYQTDDGKVLPVQIRLENRNDGKSPTFWSPPDPNQTDENHHDHLSWLLAKMWFRCADSNVQVFCKHFARAHAINEVIAVAVYRNLPNAHPIFRLLQPHIQGIIPINVQARNVLINPGRNIVSSYLSGGDNFMRVLSNYYSRFNYEKLILPEEIKRRGVGELPGYYFRDDILAYWEILGNYTRRMVDISYPSDKDVTMDTELHNMLKEVVEVGFRGFKEGAGFPRRITTKIKLVEYLTAIIVNVSVYHTAVNFQTFTNYAFVPNSPTYMMSPPPKQNTTVTMEMILQSLPVEETTFLTMAVCYVLGTYSPIERLYLGSTSENKLGMLGENMAIAPEQEESICLLVEELRGLKRRIDQRNKGKFIKYDVMRPDNTPITTQI